MESTEVIIVGAGPSGLALAIALAHRGVKSIILEMNDAICEDPRAIALAGDSHRIISLLGITVNKLSEFAQRLTTVYFQEDTFTSPRPFLVLEHGSDGLQQALPGATAILQPRLEQTLRDLLAATGLAELRTQCMVTHCADTAEGSVQVTYARAGSEASTLKGDFLVGADGKRGVVRKEFLEPKGIRQLVGLHEYSAIWIAANLHITLPTPESHPDFPLWKMGVQPEQLWDIFWPKGFFFCNHPTMPIATGRFGPVDDRYWRFEYELPGGAVKAQAEADPVGHLESQMARHLTLPPSTLAARGIPGAAGPVLFPWDCVRVVRCGPAHFRHTVVNRWFDRRTMLIGDAAHVFPPFGAQGIANGVRDALALAWRLGFLVDSKKAAAAVAETSSAENGATAAAALDKQTAALLTAWSVERRRGVDNGSVETMNNGRLLLNKSRLVVRVLRVANFLLRSSALLRRLVGRALSADSGGFAGVRGGFFLERAGGGGKVAQTWVRRAAGGDAGLSEPLFLSDHLFWRNAGGVLTLLALGPLRAEEAAEVGRAVQHANAVRGLLADEVVELAGVGKAAAPTAAELQTLPVAEGAKRYLRIASVSICPLKELEALGVDVLKGHDPEAFRKRFQSKTRFALIRPDYIVFAQAKDVGELERQLMKAREMLLQV